MPAIQLARLKIQVTDLLTHFSDPTNFVTELHTLLDFYADRISGAQRLSNGNTLICDGPDGYFFEVTPAGDTVWAYQATGAAFRVTRYEGDFSDWIENQ